MIVQRTLFRQVVVRLQSKEGYPKEYPLIELRSKFIEDSVLEKLETAAIDKVREQKESKSILLSLIEFFHFSVHNNKLLHCKDELDEIHSLIKSDDVIKLNYKRGTILIHQREMNYHAKFRITVPDEYPEEPVEFVFLENNFHPFLTSLFTTRVQFLLKRVLNGYKYSLKNIETSNKKGDGISAPPSTGDLHEIRKDLQFLKKVQDLKELNHDKQMRREHTRLIKSEVKNIEVKEQELLEQDEAFKQQQLKLQKAMDRRTLFPVAGFIMKDLIYRLPHSICDFCKQSLLPDKPPAIWSAKTSNENMEKNIRVERLSCDHWYHFICLEKLLSQPPFEDKKCISDNCDKSIEHNYFNIKYIRKAEEKWKKKEERRRELEDIADFMS